MVDIHCCFNVIVVDELTQPMLVGSNLLRILKASVEFDMATMTIPRETSADTRVIILAKHVEGRGVSGRLRRGIEYANKILMETTNCIHDILCTSVEENNISIPVTSIPIGVRQLKAPLLSGKTHHKSYNVIQAYEGGWTSIESNFIPTSLLMVLLKESCDKDMNEAHSSESEMEAKNRLKQPAIDQAKESTRHLTLLNERCGTSYKRLRMYHKVTRKK